MFSSNKAMPASELAKWCAYALILLAPGSFFVLPFILIGRHWHSRRARLEPLPHRASER